MIAFHFTSPFVGVCALFALFAEVFQPAPQWTAVAIPQACDDVLVLHSSGHQFRACLHHFGQQFLASLIDEGDVFEVHHRARQWGSFPGMMPAGAQLLHPWTGQAAAEAPPLTVGSVGVGNSKHWHPSLRLREGMPAAKYGALILKQLFSVCQWKTPYDR
jgi:hypothetical protein